MIVLVDSSVWIAADRKESVDYTKLRKLISSDSHQICIARPICLEVCQGARNIQEFEYLWSGFSGFQDLPVTESVWHKSALNFMRCRKKGVSITTLDCLIATLASEYNASLWSNDKIFHKVSGVLNFELWA